MNNRGQVFFFALMLGLVVIVMALALAKPVMDQVDTSRNATNMDCSNSTISDFDKAACVSADMTIFYFVGGLLFIGGATIVAKLTS